MLQPGNVVLAFERKRGQARHMSWLRNVVLVFHRKWVQARARPFGPATEPVPVSSPHRQERQLIEALKACGKCSVGYLGGGDFLVHLFGIDGAIDEAILIVEDDEKGRADD